MTSTELPLIICFGDSLTAGFQSPAPGCPDFLETPYGKFLEERLRNRACVQVSGVCGELTREMLGRFANGFADCLGAPRGRRNIVSRAQATKRTRARA